MILVMKPLPIASVAVSRGSGGDNLRSVQPKEAWVDSAAGSAATLTFDLGAAHSIDTVLLGYVANANPAATWSLSGGVAGPGEFAIQGSTALRVPDGPDQFEPISHALWHGAPLVVRYLSASVVQGAGGLPLTASVLVAARAFKPSIDKEWGAGRRIVDTGSVTPLADGGFAIVEGVRKRHYGWTFGDLSEAEANALESIALGCGETQPGLVIEDPAFTSGLRARIHYGLFERWRAFERRNRIQTRWEVGIEEWV